MGTEIKNLQPKAVWNYFYDFTQIPRPTGQMKEVTEYVKNVGKELGLEVKQDEVGNVLIKKPATPGFEDRPTVAIQGHLDMVPQKNNDKVHDFTKDPIDAWIDGEWVKARETTLGADNAIGVAMGLAALAEDDLEHGPLEVLMTVDEEVGMVGANALQKGFSNADILLNLDSEEDGILYVGCAGGVDITASLEYQDDVKPVDGTVQVRIDLKGLKGGHSGGDIHLGRGNANKMIVRFLKKAVEAFGINIVDMEGGSLRNAIPREGWANVMVPADEVEDFIDFVKQWEELYIEEYNHIEEGISFTATVLDEMPATIVPQDIAENAIHAIEACQNGAITYLADFPDTVEASSNLAIMKLGGGEMKVQFLTRSSSDSRKEMVQSSIGSAFELMGAKVEYTGSYSGWQPNLDAHVIEVMREVMKEMYGEYPETLVMHAGLECGILLGAMPDTEMISFGPTILHPHSPDEKVHIESVARNYELLKRTLAAL